MDYGKHNCSQPDRPWSLFEGNVKNCLDFASLLIVAHYFGTCRTLAIYVRCIKLTNCALILFSVQVLQAPYISWLI